MNTLFLSQSYRPVLGGLQAVVGELAEQFVQKGHRVQVLTSRYPRTLSQRETIANVSVERLLFLARRNYGKRLDLTLASQVIQTLTRWRLRQILCELRPKIINIHFPDQQVPFLLNIIKSSNARIVVSLHGDDVERFCEDSNSMTTQQRIAYARLAQLVLRADAVTACSQSLLNKATALFPTIERRGHVIYNGIDLGRFDDTYCYGHPRPFVFALGRLTHKKGFDVLIDAWRVSGLGDEFDLLIAGSGEEYVSLQQRINTLRIISSIHLIGRATAQQVVHLLNACCFVAIPSRKEPFGLVAIEALGAGKPIMSTSVGGLKEILDGSSNILVGATVEKVAQGLMSMVAKKADWTDIGRKNRLLSQKFGMEQMVSTYESVLLPYA